MYGRFALYAQILSGFYETGSEVELPQPVDLDAGSQGMVRTEEPLGEAEPVGRGSGGHRGQEGRHREAHFFQRLFVVAPAENMRLAGFGLLHHHDAGEFLGFVSPEGRLRGDDLFDIIMARHRGEAAVVKFRPDAARGVFVGFVRRGLADIKDEPFPVILLRFGGGNQLVFPFLLQGITAGFPLRSGGSFQCCFLLLQFGHPRFILGRGQFHHRRAHPDAGGIKSGSAAFRDVIKTSHQAVVVLLGHRIILVIVALGTGHGEAEEYGAGDIHAVEQHHVALLFGNGPALAIQEVVPVEGSGDFLIGGGGREQVAGELPGAKLIERHVAVERPHHPVAPDPLEGIAVLLEAIAVGISGGVQPGDGHAFAISGRGEQPVHCLFISHRGSVSEEDFDFCRGRRQTGQVVGDAAEQGRGIGFRGGCQLMRFQFVQDKVVDLVPGPWIVIHLRKQRPHRREEGPVRLIAGAFRDPLFQLGLLLRGHGTVGIRGRHHFVRIGAEEPLHQFAGFGIAGHKSFLRQSRLALVEAQVGLAVIGVLSVAIIAVFREDGADVAVEVHGARWRRAGTGENQQEEMPPGRESRLIHSHIRLYGGSARNSLKSQGKGKRVSSPSRAAVILPRLMFCEKLRAFSTNCHTRQYTW